MIQRVTSGSSDVQPTFDHLLAKVGPFVSRRPYRRPNISPGETGSDDPIPSHWEFPNILVVQLSHWPVTGTQTERSSVLLEFVSELKLSIEVVVSSVVQLSACQTRPPHQVIPLAYLLFVFVAKLTRVAYLYIGSIASLFLFFPCPFSHCSMMDNDEDAED